MIEDGNIVGDPEGLAILKTSPTNGYLIASSQGNNTFNIYNRTEPHAYVGSFQIKENNSIDGVSDTDGLEIVNTFLNSDFAEGLLVVQDGKILVKIPYLKRILNYYLFQKLNNI